MTSYFSPPRRWARQLHGWLLPAVLLASAGAASAATINVPADQPNIQAAITASSDGDTILIADGTYTGPGNVDIDFGGKNITVTSRNGAASTIIDCGGSGSADHRGFILQNGETNAVISGLTIKNGYESGDSGGGVYNVDATVTVTDCIFSDNLAIYYGAGIDNESTISITGCTFTNNAAYYGGGIENDNTATITNCTVTGNSANSGGNGGGMSNFGPATVTNCTITGNSVLDGGVGGGIYSADAVTMTNCTLTGNTAPGSTGGGFYNDSTATLTNDILWGDGNGEIVDYGNAVTASYSDVQGGMVGTGNINVDPLFHSATDFHLQATSPCLSAGTASGAPATDKDGTVRPASPSIGAYELTPSPSPPPHWEAQAIAVGADNQTRLLWKSAGGACTVWTIAANGAITSTVPYGPYGDYQAQALAVGSDNQTRLLWKSAGGACTVWTIAANGAITSTVPYGPYGDYQAQTIAVGADNQTRLFWKSAGGACTVWTIAANGAITSTVPYGPYGDYQAQALAVGSDNQTRLLWKSAGGACTVWSFASGSSITSTGLYGPFPSIASATDWQAQALAVGADNQSHLLWKDAAGACTVWTITADGNITSTVPYGPYPSMVSTTDWQAKSLAVGADGGTRLLWKDAAGACTVWTIAANGAVTSTIPYGPY